MIFSDKKDQKKSQNAMQNAMQNAKKYWGAECIWNEGIKAEFNEKVYYYEPIPLFKNAEPWIKIVCFLTTRVKKSDFFKKSDCSKMNSGIGSYTKINTF